MATEQTTVAIEEAAFVPSVEHEEAIQSWLEALRSRKFVVCVDGSDDSDLALKNAVELANPELGDELFICTAYKDKHAREVTLMDKDTWYLFASKEARLILNKAIHFVEHVNSQRAKVPGKKPLIFTTHVAVGPVVRESLVEAAKLVSANFVVTGSRGLSGVRHLHVGSVSQYLVQHAPCPVLVVRIQKK